MYTVGKACFWKITSKKGKKGYWIGIGIAAFLIFAVCEVFLYLDQMEFRHVAYVLGDVISDYDIRQFFQKIANVGIVIVDVWLLILLVQRVLLKKEKLEFNVRNGVFVVSRYLVGGYLLTISFVFCFIFT